MTHFTFLFSSNKCANYPEYTQASAKNMSSLKVSKLSFSKAPLYGLGFANATFYLSIASNCWYFFLLLGYFLHPLLSTLLQVASAISNDTFT